jgi:hypothetical protein
MGSFHAAAGGSAFASDRVPADGYRTSDAVRRTLLWVLCTYACIHMLHNMGSEGAWLKLGDAMAFRSAPPFNHRVLFVLLARAFHRLDPALHVPACYFLSQIVAAAAAFLVIEPWSRRFVAPRHAEWSRPLLLLLLIPTFTYWTFYDLGIVFFHTAALLALVRRRHNWFLLAFAAGTLNHENTLLLVPVALVLRRRSGMPWGAALTRMGIELALYGAIRVALFRLLPEPAAWQAGKFAYNLGLVTWHSKALAKTTVWLLGWGAIVFGARRRLAPDFIAAGTILLAGILATAVVFGQLNELRLFDAFLPVAVVGVLSAMAPDAALMRAEELPQRMTLESRVA